MKRRIQSNRRQSISTLVVSIALSMFISLSLAVLSTGYFLSQEFDKTSTKPSDVRGCVCPECSNRPSAPTSLERCIDDDMTKKKAGGEYKVSTSMEEPGAVITTSYINPLIASIKPSKTIEIFSKVKELQASGVDVTSLCVGEPDFLPSQVVLDAIVQAVHDGDTRYTAVTGTAELRQAIATDLQRRKGITYNPATEIVVCNGAKQCVYQGILATAGAGDAVIIPSPYWTSYPEMVALAGAEPVILEATAGSGFLVTPHGLRAALKAHPNTKLIILNNPSNPTGTVYEIGELEALSAVLQDFPHVKVLADEIYERLVYTKSGNCPSFAAIPGMLERTLTVNGFSKTYSMTGLRLGYVAAPAPITRAIATIQSQLTSCASSLSQAAGVAALLHVSEDEIQANVELLKEKRDYVLQELASMPHVEVSQPPQGAFYVLPKVAAYCGEVCNDAQFCLDLLEQEQLALVPGSSFGAPGTVRISYATSFEELATAMSKLRNFLESRPTVGV